MNAKKLNLLLTCVLLVSLAGIALEATVSPALAQGAWYAEYFANASLSGGPTLTRYDDSLNFDWGSGSPGSGIPTDNFSARWTRDAWFEAGTYRFSYRADDGIRIWVGDKLIVDAWRDQQAAWSFVDLVMVRGTQRVRVEYYEHGGGAIAQVQWERLSGGSAWRAEYYSTKDLGGGPVLVRYDPAVDFDWGYGSPDAAVPADNFSVRWTYTLGFNAGSYRFYTSGDDGMRIWVDGNLVVDAWYNQKLPNTHWGDISLSGGQHTVVVEYYEQGGEASAHAWWNLLSSFGGWEGRYYDNAEMRGGPALIRDDASINFDWGEGAPASWMPADSFSVVWTRQVSFDPGYYRFYAQSDDGVRVWIDDALVMDYWRAMDYEWHYLNWTYLEGHHTVKVEYYEGAGGARIHFWWEKGSPVQPTPIPKPSPGKTPVPIPDPDLPAPWRGEYFDNPNLSGSPILARDDAKIDFNWGWGAPDSRLPDDDFSVRWTNEIEFSGGRYTFSTFSDDGVRLYVDGKRVVDSWRPMRGYRSATLDLSPGTHTIRLEYFERSGVARARLSWYRR